jgi:hypothetical protein
MIAKRNVNKAKNRNMNILPGNHGNFYLQGVQTINYLLYAFCSTTMLNL